MARAVIAKKMLTDIVRVLFSKTHPFTTKASNGGLPVRFSLNLCANGAVSLSSLALHLLSEDLSEKVWHREWLTGWPLAGKTSRVQNHSWQRLMGACNTGRPRWDV